MVSSIFNLPTQHKLQQNVSLRLNTVYATAASIGLSTAFLMTPSHSYLGSCQSIKRFKERHGFHFFFKLVWSSFWLSSDFQNTVCRMLAALARFYFYIRLSQKPSSELTD